MFFCQLERIIQANGFQDKIIAIRGKIEEVDIPEKVDVILSEWMGYCLLFENMLSSVLIARNRFLSPIGSILPNEASLYIAAFENEESFNDYASYWENVEGFDFSPIKDWAIQEPSVQTCEEEDIISSTYKLITLDLHKVEVEDLTFSSNFSIEISEFTLFTGFVVWFSVFFKGDQKLVPLDTSPHSPSTHWRQTLFFLPDPIQLEINVVVKGTFSIHPNSKNPRDQDVDLTYLVEGEQYHQTYKIR